MILFHADQLWFVEAYVNSVRSHFVHLVITFEFELLKIVYVSLFGPIKKASKRTSFWYFWFKPGYLLDPIFFDNLDFLILLYYGFIPCWPTLIRWGINSVRLHFPINGLLSIILLSDSYRFRLLLNPFRIYLIFPSHLYFCY